LQWPPEASEEEPRLSWVGRPQGSAAGVAAPLMDPRSVGFQCAVRARQDLEAVACRVVEVEASSPVDLREGTPARGFFQAEQLG
jgi:hypothetical protein